jgi:YD repeat-containing protein
VSTLSGAWHWWHWRLATVLRRKEVSRTSQQGEYTYNRQGERVTKKDQNETVHAYEYDALGRPTADKVTAVGTGVDDAVRRIATTYEVRGMVATITSYATCDDASSSSSSSNGSDAVNQVVFEYDDSGKLVKEYQEHDGVKDANTPYVGYHVLGPRPPAGCVVGIAPP